MENNYVVPELELIGDASKIVQGLMGIGPDVYGQILVNDMEFLED